MPVTPNSQPSIPGPGLIFLIGMPGAGKTYWGERVAKQYELPLIDLDEFVAMHEKASIAALFAAYGENGFREREHKHLRKVIETAQTPDIIACGGGTPCFNDNIQLMKEAGIVVYLETDIPTLTQQLMDSPEIRPLLKGRGDMAVYLAGILRKRESFYKQAHHIFHTKCISITTFEEIVASCTNRH